MKTTQPTNGMVISEDTQFQPGTYLLPDGLIIEKNGITLDGNGAHLIGEDHQNAGVKLSGIGDITIKNLQISGYRHGIRVSDSHNLTIKHCRIKDTAEIAANTTFLDIWRDANNPYGSAILLAGVRHSQIVNNDLQDQMHGLLTYYCRDLTVTGNNASYNSGFGFHLYETSHSRFINNWADYCCRFAIHQGGKGHLGADSAGFLIVHRSSNNVFQGNHARMSGDGFFLAGLSPDYAHVPCNDNLFEENDASYSPNNAFEATFSQGNRFLNNRASHSSYGFWLGYSRESEVSGNQIIHNRHAGIAAENAINMEVNGNTLQDNRFGLLIWSKTIPEFLQAVPANDTSKFWRVYNNTFHRNGTGIRIAANQDHGQLPLTTRGSTGISTTPRPHDHEINQNVISENRIGIQSLDTDRTIIKDNTFELNLSSDIKS